MQNNGGTAKTERGGFYAALDLGTNNCRLLVAHCPDQQGEGTPAPLNVVDSFSRIVRLGESISETGKLSAEAMERTIEALLICKRKMQKYNLGASRLVATEACRKASNTQEFIERVAREVGLEIEVIASEEEAKLAVLGCSTLFDAAAERAVVFDIGGGSTEVIWIDAKKMFDKRQSGSLKSSDLDEVILDWISIDSGVMNLADRFGGIDFVDVTYNDMVMFLLGKLEGFDRKNRISEIIKTTPVQMLSTSGTLTTLAAMQMGLPKYDRTKVDGSSLSVVAIREVIAGIYKMRPSERFNHPCIGSERSDFILSGCAVFDAISRMWPVADVTVADRGVREGIIISLMLNQG